MTQTTERAALDVRLAQLVPEVKELVFARSREIRTRDRELYTALIAVQRAFLRLGIEPTTEADEGLIADRIRREERKRAEEAVTAEVRAAAREYVREKVTEEVEARVRQREGAAAELMAAANTRFAEAKREAGEANERADALAERVVKLEAKLAKALEAGELERTKRKIPLAAVIGGAVVVVANVVLQGVVF